MASIIEIHNFSDPALDLYARLTENQLLNRADPENALSSQKVRSSSAARSMQAVSRFPF